MSSPTPPTPAAVFLSYAREDSEAARRIADALRRSGVEVWFDQAELHGGDAWDAKIRRQIKDCALFVPVISANTQARAEGYFRLEWKIADRRTDLIGRSKAFLVPVCIDDTRETDADVPDSFLSVQWTRLPGGAQSAGFCQRVRLLLERDAPPRPPSAAPLEKKVGIAVTQARRLAPAPRRRGLVLALTIASVAVALVVGARWKTRRESSGVGPQGAEGGTVAEARRLAARADALFDQDELAPRESLAAAEKFCQQAVALAPGDAETWAVLSRVASHYIFLTYDRSQERRAQAGDAATRAVRLAPGSYEARYALAYFYRLDEASYPEAERILRKLLEERPTDKRVWRTLGSTLRYATIFAGAYRGRDAEAAECFRRAASLPGGDPLSLHFLATNLASLGDEAESERAMAACLEAKRSGSALLQKTNLLIRYLGDVPRAREALGQVPVDQMREDFGTFIAAQVWWCAREPDKVIAVLRALPRDYMEAVVDGPKGFFIGQAHRMAGRPQAAEIEWRAALQVVERRLASQPNHTRLLLWKAWLLALLGDRTEAKRGLLAAEQLGLTVRDAYWAAGVPLELGDTDKAISLLTTVMNNPVVTTRAFLRIDPTWDRLHGDRRFDALVAAPTAAKGDPEQKSVAVLAFTNLSDDKDNEYFSDGISDELINALGRVPGLTVKGRTSAFFFKGKNVPAQEIAEKLGVAYLVRGSVRKAGSKVRITAQLSRAATDEIVWSSEPIERELRDVLVVQDEIAALIVKNLSAKLGGTAAATDSTNDRRVENVDAYEEVLKGRFHADKWTAAELNVAISHYHQALAKQPNYALAYAGLAGAYGLIRYFHYADPASVTVLYLQATAKARQLDESLPEVHHQLGNLACYVTRDFSTAEREYQHALRLNPGHVPTHLFYAFLLGALGRHAEARTHAEKARELDPLSPNAALILGWVRYWAGDVEGALQAGRDAIALSPELFNSYHLTARALARQGRYDEAFAQMELALHLSPPPEMLGDLAFLYGRAGRKAEARKLLEDLLAKSKQTYVPAYSIYRVYDGLGEIEEADRWMNQAIANNEGRIVYFRGGADEITRANPHYREWMKKIGLDP